jgi:hypothetical protein
MPTSMTDLIARVRAEIGDPPQPFRTTALGDGRTSWFDLPKQQIQVITEAIIIEGANITNLVDASASTSWSSTTSYATGAFVTYQNRYYQAAQPSTNQVPTATAYWADITASAYVINDQMGQIQLGQPVDNNATLVMAGVSWSLFTDSELAIYVSDAINQHCYNRVISERLRDQFGRIDYRDTPITAAVLPAIEVPLVVILATINTFWTLANDTATDFNIATAEGTSIDRTTQYNQIMSQISAMTERYQMLCGQLNVGIYRAETLTLRRTSRTTGRLVPVFTSQEFDDHRWAQRQLPPIDKRDEDNSDIPTAYWAGPFGV